ncbi:MAG: hypothetical protein AAF555_06840 [Verrucomicrobiota bacterium]
MKLETVQAVLRPRSGWEAIDLGVALARQHYGRILSCWVVTVLPLWLLVSALLWKHPAWAWVAVWWLKPLADKVPLFYLSRALFGERPTVWETLRAWPKLLWQEAGWLLTWRRFSPARSANLPLVQLEGLRGKTYRSRAQLLSRESGGCAFWSIKLFLVAESILLFSLIALVLLFVPQGEFQELRAWWETFWADLVGGEFASFSGGIDWMMNAFSFLTFALIAPFYVGAGFGLYLNARTQLEGWDIELTFRRLQERLERQRGASPAVTAALLVLACGLAWQEGSASPDPETTVAEVLAREEFEWRTKETTRRQWVPDLEGAGGDERSPVNWSGEVWKALGWVIVGAVLLALVVYLAKQNGRRGPAGAEPAKRAKPSTVVGLEVAPESLPQDIPARARELWAAGQRREAVALLYRGALSWFVHEEALEIEESATERDCLRQARSTPEAEYFERLTRHRLEVAYDHAELAAEDLETLCHQWPFRK